GSNPSRPAIISMI
ncbi:hypothetical protein VCEC0051_002247B, partial [Vibrio cholerae O1 str. EC-0051]